MRKRLENLAAAWALAAADAVRAETEKAAGHAAGAPAALVTLLAYPGASIERVRQAVGVTHSGGVRLVDRLEADGLVRRRRTADRRVAALELTPRGRRRAQRVLDERAKGVEQLLAPLSEPERASLTELLERLLMPLPKDHPQLERICRLCDYWTCDGTTQACPVGRGARGRRDARRANANSMDPRD